MNKNDFFLLFFSVFVCLLAGFVGSLFTVDSISSWYVFLNKPFFTPPSWVFAPVWTALYILMGLSLFFVLRKGFIWKVKIASGLFFVQLFLNFLWSILFFGLKNPFLALIEIIFLWTAILFTLFFFYRIEKKSAYLLIPYFLWVSFASLLNYFIWILN